MSKILIETRLNSLKLNESHQARKGCLGRIEGICADYGNPTRNGRFYSRELWERVFNDDLIKESLESKTLIGELDHPEDRFEPLAKEACVVLTDYKFDDDNKVVLAGFDILDTPSGRILKSLLDYGCVMGVSSRGQGDIIDNGTHEEVEPNSYEFACFDVVTTPAVAIARQRVTESVNNQKIKSLNDSILEQVNNSTTNAELDTILRVVESTEISNLSAVKQAIKDKRKSIVEGKTISDKTLNDLRDAKKEIKELKKELESKNSKTIREHKDLMATASNLSSQVLAYKHRETRLISTVESMKKRANEQNSLLSDKSKEISSLRKRVSALTNENKSLLSDLSTVKENLENSQASVSNLSTQLKKSNRQVERLNKTLETKDGKITNLTESATRQSSKLNQLTESSNSRIETLSNELKSCNESLETSKKELSTTKSQLSDTSNKLNECINKLSLTESKLAEATNQATLFRDKYIEVKACQFGIDKELISEGIGKNPTIESIDNFVAKYLEKLDRYSSLPFSASASNNCITILSENLKSRDVDDEMEASTKFIELASGLK